MLASVRLDRLLSKWNLASRSRAAELVRAGRVRVDGAVAKDPGLEVDPARLCLELDGRRAAAPETTSRVVLVYNKPRGEVATTRDERGRRTVMDAFASLAIPGLAPVGRLDQASAGLLLLTNDHAFADRLLDPRSHLPKVYRVKIRGRLDAAALEDLRTSTVEEEGLVLGPLELAIERDAERSQWLRVVLREGKNRQIRRRLARHGAEVEHLIRIAFGPLELGGLAPGAWRELEAAERASLERASERATAE
jgi:23S rRNA pseudouridine2605 synthase